MFESNMDEYLDEEIEYIKQSFEMICRTWEKTVSTYSIYIPDQPTDELDIAISTSYCAHHYARTSPFPGIS